jgi:glycosyltransferase involved in cell wall biosynthesis
MKILCVINGLGSGGAQRQLVELALGFNQKGHTVSFLTYYDDPFFENVLDNAMILSTCLKESNYLMRFFKMVSFIRKGKFDAVLSFLEAPNFICEVAGIPFRNWKLVVGERNANPKILKSVKLRIYRWFHVLADYIVANSSANLQLVHSVNPLLADLKCKVIYNIIDFDRWKPIENFSFRKKTKLKIVTAGSQTYKKNLKGLIEALSLLEKSELNELTVDWYGDGLTEPYYDNSFLEAYKRVKSYGLADVISFHPATHDITGIIQESDALGLFSFYEGFPNSVCEGMACGKPIICSAVSDLPNLLSHDSNLLFDPAEPQSIKQAIRYLISLTNDQLSQIGSENQRIAKEMFDREKSISGYLKLFGA